MQQFGIPDERFSRSWRIIRRSLTKYSRNGHELNALITCRNKYDLIFGAHFLVLPMRDL